MATAALTLLGERSQQNGYFKHVITLYLYATGASRQAISVLAHLGVGSSYTTIAASNNEAKVDSEPQPKLHSEVTLTSESTPSSSAIPSLQNSEAALATWTEHDDAEHHTECIGEDEELQDSESSDSSASSEESDSGSDLDTVDGFESDSSEPGLKLDEPCIGNGDQRERTDVVYTEVRF